AACVLTWASMLPVAFRNADGLPLSPRLDLVVAVLRLCGIAGLVTGIVDALQQRTEHDRHRIAETIIRQPVVWGSVFVINFFALLYQGAFHSPLLSRYCARHPIEIIEMTVFFVGLAALILRFFDVIRQFPSLRAEFLGYLVPVGGQAIEECDGLLGK